MTIKVNTDTVLKPTLIVKDIEFNVSVEQAVFLYIVLGKTTGTIGNRIYNELSHIIDDIDEDEDYISTTKNLPITNTHLYESEIRKLAEKASLLFLKKAENEN